MIAGCALYLSWRLDRLILAGWYRPPRRDWSLGFTVTYRVRAPARPAISRDPSQRDPAARGARAPGNWLVRQFVPHQLFVWAILLSVPLLLPRLVAELPRLSDRPEYQLPVTEIRYTPAPVWVASDFLEQVRRLGELPERLPLLDPELTGRLSRAFAAHPWVGQVVSVEKTVERRIQVTLEYRRPVAVVELGSERTLIDRDGIVLPPVDQDRIGPQRLPRIVDVRSLPPSRMGARWAEPEISGAAEIAALLLDDWTRLELATIVVPRRTSALETLAELQFELTTTGGSRIAWGRAPSVDAPGELTPVQKLGRLNKYVRDFGGFDDAHGPYDIDIRHWQEISRRPLAMQQPTRDPSRTRLSRKFEPAGRGP